jgi:predicted SnoaL-like aldol condensation-catalyzing enzyme
VSVQPGRTALTVLLLVRRLAKKVQFATSDFYRIERGKVVEHWDVVDSLPHAVALGLVPAPGPN